MDIIEPDLSHAEYAEAIVRVINAYARELHGERAALRREARERLVSGLHRAGAQVYLALVDGEAAGIAVCFRGFSTWTARPLLNVHDFAVLPSYRRRGIGRALLDHIEERAREMGCIRLTLEVDFQNDTAKRLYRRSGFAPRQEFWTKPLR